MQSAGRSGFDLRVSLEATAQQTGASNAHRFYRDLDSFDDFAQVQDLDRYAPAPDDWTVVLADIRGSTKAIREGRYKDVNMIGAACITAVLNVVGEVEVAYVFGGDGATLLVPQALLPEIRAALLKTKNLAKTGFGLDLRVGAVSLPAIRDAGHDVLVAKFRLSQGNYLAMFNGGGIALADRLVKSDSAANSYLFAETGDGDEPDLDGLSCRWEPLKAQRGVMVSLLVQPLGSDRRDVAAVTGRVLSELSTAIGHEIEQNRPVTADNMTFKWPPSGLIAEARATHRQGRGFKRRLVKILIQSFIQYLLEKFDKEAGGYNAPVYREELRQNSDYRRFDDTLRLVLDCPADEVARIETVLEDLRAEGLVAYGIHKADSALMTCVLFSLEDSEHVHFIDGAHGGFAMAAVGLKDQLRDSAIPAEADRR